MTIPELIYSFNNEEIRIRIMDADTELLNTAFWKTDYSVLAKGTDEFQYPELHKYDDAIIVFWDIVGNGNAIEIYVDF